MKKLNVLFAAGLLAMAGAAIAQDASNEDAPAKTTASRPDVGVNPFTGRPLTAEELQRQLEAARLQTAALEELLKQTTLTSEIATVPLRKGSEQAQARLNTRNEELKLKELERVAKEAEAAAARQKADAAESSKREKARAKNPQTTSTKGPSVEAMQPAPLARPTLLSVMDVGGSRSAVLDFGGNTLVVADGGVTPFGPISIGADHSVKLNGQPFKVSGSTLSRFQRSDTGDAPARGASASLPAPASSTPVAAPSTNTPVGSAGQVVGDSSGAPARLPPLQLPPGMTVMPPSR